MSNKSPQSASLDAPKVHIYDTTLRDGSQREGLSLSCDDKIRIAQKLDAFGVAFIEGGWPGSNPKDVAFFERAKTMTWDHALITAFGATRRAGMRAEEDPQLQKLVQADTPACTIFGKTWNLHVTDVLRTTLEENVAMIEDSVRFLAQSAQRDGSRRRVIYDAEHFFDGYKADPAYALETVQAAVRGGAEAVVLCDTNGGSMPWEVEEMVGHVYEKLVTNANAKAVIGIHTHDDSGCGVANALAAVRAGARHVQGTINGYGERCGNANLCSIIPDVTLKMGLSCVPESKLAELYDLAHYVAEVANLPPNDHAAYVGRSAFAHKGGVHVAAIRRHPDSYQHIKPELVGNECRVVVSELSGRGNVLSKAEEMGLEVSSEDGVKILAQVKEAEAQGFAYEAAEASFALLMARQEAGYVPPFDILDFQTAVGKRKDNPMWAEATVKVRVHAVGSKSQPSQRSQPSQTVHTAGEGNGPVSALDQALRKALEPFYPSIQEVHLHDYKVRILDGIQGTQATTRVLIDSGNGHETWSTVGASSNIIEASLHALVDSMEYSLRLVK